MGLRDPGAGASQTKGLPARKSPDSSAGTLEPEGRWSPTFYRKLTVSQARLLSCEIEIMTFADTASPLRGLTSQAPFQEAPNDELERQNCACAGWKGAQSR